MSTGFALGHDRRLADQGQVFEDRPIPAEELWIRNAATTAAGRRRHVRGTPAPGHRSIALYGLYVARPPAEISRE